LVGVLGGLGGADLGPADLAGSLDLSQAARLRLGDGTDDVPGLPALPAGFRNALRPAAGAERPATAMNTSTVTDCFTAPAPPTAAPGAAPQAAASAAVGPAESLTAHTAPPALAAAQFAGVAPGSRLKTLAPVKGTQAATGMATEARHMQAGQAYGQLPLSFEPNMGQTASRVDYLAHTDSGTVFLTPTAAVFAMQGHAAAGNPHSAGLPGTAPQAQSTNAGVALYMDMVGANPAARPVGQEEQAGKANYLIGNDPARWHADVPMFGRVEYPNVYSGVSLAYYGGPGGLEYDLTVSPGADAHAIALKFDGAESVAVNPQGDLVVHTAAGELVQHAPVVYQGAGGQRQPVSGRFVLDSGLVRFGVGAYDHTRPLVIDPLVLGYSTYLGGSKDDYGYGIAVDAAGNAYVGGVTASPNFPTTPGAYNTTGPYGGFVTKLNPAGSALVYSTYVGTSYIYGIAVDGAGNAYVTGNGGFVTKLNPTGSALVYSATVGNAEGRAIAVDGAGNAYITGSVDKGQSILVTPGAFDGRYNGGPTDAFAAKLNASGTALEYATYLGGWGMDQGYGIAVDGAGDAYVTGQTDSGNYPATAHFGPARRGAFITKLNPAGSALAYSGILGGESGNGVFVDAVGHAYVAGSGGTGLPATTYFGGQGFGAFVAKLNAGGTALDYLDLLSDASGTGIAVDGAGSTYLIGSSGGKGFPTTPDAFQPTFQGGYDAVFAKLNPAGNAVVYATYLGGNDNDDGYGIAVDGSGSAYLSGEANSQNFPVTPGAFQTTFGGGDGSWGDAFVAKFAEV
jgi:hypothetical protein